MKNGKDQNLSFWVISEALKIPDITPQAMVAMSNQVPEGMRTLQAYALRMDDVEILSEIKNKRLASVVRSDESGEPQEEPGLMVSLTLLRHAFNQKNFEIRMKHIKRARR